MNPSRRRSRAFVSPRSEEHTSELQSRPHLVCRLLLEKKKTPVDDGDHGEQCRQIGPDRVQSALRLPPGFRRYFFFNDTATTEIYTLSLQRRSSDLATYHPIASIRTAPTRTKGQEIRSCATS